MKTRRDFVTHAVACVLPAGLAGCGGSEEILVARGQAPVNIIPFYGQSNSTGATDFSQTWRTPMIWDVYPPGYPGTLDGEASITSTPDGKALTLSADYLSLARLTGLPLGFSGEGAVHGMLDSIAAEHRNHAMMTFSGGAGGMAISELDKPSPAEIAAMPAATAERRIAAAGQTLASLEQYSIFDCRTNYYVFMWLLCRSAKLVREQGMRPVVSALVWQQGESDLAHAAAYPTLFAQLCKDLEADVAAITSQPERFVILSEAINYSSSLELPSQAGYQTWVASGYTDLTAYRAEAARINDAFEWDLQQDKNATALRQASPRSDVYMAAPRYPHTSCIHMHPHAARAHGEQFGKVYRKVVIQAQPWEPVRPVDWWISGTRIFVRFSVPRGPLQLAIPPQGDTQAVDSALPYGFEHSAGAIAQAKTLIVEPDLICIEPDVAPAVGQTLSYCKSARYGSLCDSDTTRSLYTDKAGVANVMRNYCVPFSITL